MRGRESLARRKRRPVSVYGSVATSVELTHHAQRSICIERGLTGLYRWYIGRSQTHRTWNPDRDFAWRALRQDQPDAVHAVIEGFYAVEQFVPDYVRTLLRVIRESYGRSHFHLRWGAEEEKHADLWRNALLSLGRRSVSWVEAQTRVLRARTYELPWDDPLHMLFYTVFQERATHVVYKALESAVSGGQPRGLIAVPDPVLARAAATIALDEAAHYHFFLQASRLYLYYFPEESVRALVDVLRHFSMPAHDLIPGYDEFGRVLHQSGLFGRRAHYTDVVQVALNHLGLPGVRAIEAGIQRSRMRPDVDSPDRDAAGWLDAVRLERGARGVFAQATRYAEEAGVGHTLHGEFIPLEQEHA
jgi:acyl-[acyl-carrier-protein] desaturase